MTLKVAGNIHGDHGGQNSEQDWEENHPHPSQRDVHKAIIGLVWQRSFSKALQAAVEEMAKLGGLQWKGGRCF
jgi:hypothetical protein